MHYTQRTSCADTFIRDTWQSFHIWSCAEFQLHINKKNANNQLNVHCWYCSHCYVWDIEWKNIFSKEEIFCNFSFPFLTPQSKNFLFFVFHHKTRAWTCGFTRVPRLLKRDSPVSNFWQDLRVKKHRIVRWQLFSLCWACWHVLSFHNVNQQRKFPFHLWKEVLVSKRQSYIHNTKTLSNGACSCHMPSAKRPCFLVIFIYIVAGEKRTATE